MRCAYFCPAAASSTPSSASLEAVGRPVLGSQPAISYYVRRAAKNSSGSIFEPLKHQQRSADAAVRQGMPRATSETIDKLLTRSKD